VEGVLDELFEGQVMVLEEKGDGLPDSQQGEI
jgi:hypothetical protein